jgi:hypothetical protein
MHEPTLLPLLTFIRAAAVEGFATLNPPHT